MFIQSPKGTRDVLPSEVYRWQHVEKVFSELCASFGYREIRTPVFEYTELFQRGVGDSTDIVRKEMYTFNDKSGRSLTLRPEGTAGVVRSYVENGMSSLPHPIKMYYNLSFYRYENVQKGRYREFRQLGAEAFGAAGPSVDVEIISLVDMFFRRLGLKDTSLHINSIGCPRCRAQYQEKLKDYFRPLLSGLCGDCRSRFEINPMRIIDCKRDKCKELTADVPYLLDNLCGECGAHFEGLKAGLENLGIGYIVDPRIVRGLDYYQKRCLNLFRKMSAPRGRSAAEAGMTALWNCAAELRRRG